MQLTGRATTGDRPPLVLAGVDGLAGRVRLTLRAACRVRCDARALRGPGGRGCARAPAAARSTDARVRVVGRGKLDGVPLGPLPPPAGTLEAGSTFLVTDGVEPLLALRELDAVPRTFTWTRVLDPAAVHPWNADPRARASLQTCRGRLRGHRRRRPGRAADRAVAAEAARGRAAAAFALIAAGLAATVLLAFAAFAAAEQRDDVAEELRRLRAMAARRRAPGRARAGRGGRAGVRGRGAGAALAVGATALVTARASTWRRARSAAVGGRGAASAAGAAGVGRRGDLARSRAGLLHLRRADRRARPVGRRDGDRRRRARRWRSRGACGWRSRPGASSRSAGSPGRPPRAASVDASALAAGGTVDPVLVLAPGAAALACGLLALRVVPPLLRGLARAAERLPVAPVPHARRARAPAGADGGGGRGRRGRGRRGHVRARATRARSSGARSTRPPTAPPPTSAASRPARRQAERDDSPVVRIDAEALGQPLRARAARRRRAGAAAAARLARGLQRRADRPAREAPRRRPGRRAPARRRDPARRARARPPAVRVSGASAVLQLAIQRRDGTFGAPAPRPRTPARPRQARRPGPARRPRRDRRSPSRSRSAAAGSGTSSLGEVEPGTLIARTPTGAARP